MAVKSKKDKLIEEAQKFALRGQLDKAANAYEQILALDPNAVSLRQKLAELFIKCGRSDDARKELETIGKYFSKNGFYLKSIAVYKQLQKLFPADISLSITLAELNEKHGLIANSLSEYKLVYEYYEKDGNISGALGILDRMQNVDPQSVPIKIKLAEAYLQQGKKDESYALFAKTASLLSERGDSATLSRVHARIQQLFPDKPDFMLATLTEQIRQGNAATAINGIQQLLRSNPNNKPSWELAVLAYQQLEQPQRVKIAYQHYLKYFPSEPAAIYGLITSITAESNLTSALELLDKYEAALISAGFIEQLEQIYNSLDKIDPINIKVLEGLIRVASAEGNESKLSSLTSKLMSLRSVSGSASNDSKYSKSQPVFSEEKPLSDQEINVSPFESKDQPEQTISKVFGPFEDELISTTEPETEQADAEADTLTPTEEDFEIDIEFDIDPPDQESGTASAHDNWLDSVEDLFETIDTAPRVVKFGSEMDNSDAQSHFDLGQAFKEMGLFDEAINEFREASQDATRRVECLIMQCACLRERGELEKAIKMLLALLKPGLSEEDRCALKYELATALEAAGKTEDAKSLLNEIYDINPAFRDICSRLNTATHSESLDFSDDDLNDFGLK